MGECIRHISICKVSYDQRNQDQIWNLTFDLKVILNRICSSIIQFFIFTSALSHPISSYDILSYLVLSYPILSYLILSYSILSYSILSYHILTYPILSYAMLCYAILSYAILCYRTLPDPIQSYTVPCHTLLFYTKLCDTILYHTIQFVPDCTILNCYTISLCIISYHKISCPTPPDTIILYITSNLSYCTGTRHFCYEKILIKIGIRIS